MTTIAKYCDERCILIALAAFTINHLIRENYMRKIISCLLALTGFALHASDNMPSGCVPLTIAKETVMLSTKKPLVMMIHNTSPNDLWITHPVSEPSASAGWSSRLDADNWSALAFDKKEFELSCIESKPGHEQQVPCAGVIAVCEWDGVSFPETLSGTFWAGENMTLSALIAHVSERGLGLPKAAVK